MAPRKTKISGIQDTSSYGATMSTEIAISKKSVTNIIKMMRGSKYFKQIKGSDQILGDSQYQLLLNKDTKDERVLVTYTFTNSGSRTFFNAQGNPTTLIAGRNDIPVIVKGYEGNAVLSTFQYCNRLLYAVLDYVPSTHPFLWSGTDKNTFVNGEINIKEMQFAWYSGELNDRNRVLNYLRACYGGTKSTEGLVKNLTEGMGINARIWDNSEGNINLAALHGKRPVFSMTFYSKDEHPEFNGDEKTVARLENLVRFDCTLYYRFFEANKIKTVKDLEAKYRELCEVEGYDKGFVKWLSQKIVKHLKMDYVLGLTRESYWDCIRKCDAIKGDHAKKLADHWLNRGQLFETVKEAAAFHEIPEKHFKEHADSVLSQTGIDITVPRSYLSAVLFNRSKSHMTAEEEDEFTKQSNNRVDFDELSRRDAENATGIKQSLLDQSGVLKIRRMNPIKINVDSLWVVKQFGE